MSAGLAHALAHPSALETKRAQASLSRVTADGVFEGYASLFGVADLGRDVVLRGAFSDSLKHRGPHNVRMLWQHDAKQPIGRWLSIEEDLRGLKVRGRLNLEVARAREVLALMREGAVDGLSIGYNTRRATTDRSTGLRRLHAIDLWEISVVTFPMLPQARVTAKAAALRASRAAPSPRDLRQRLAQLAWRKSALRVEHALRLGRTLDLARPTLGASGYEEPGRREHKMAFDTYVRAGEAAGLKSLEAKALFTGSGVDGGYLVPPAAEQEILRRMATLSPIRSIATVREISTSSLRKAFSFAGPAAGWVAETDVRPQTANQQIADLTFPAMELYAMPAATQTLLDDAAVDIEQWIADEVYAVFAEQEGAAFVHGDGNHKPKGFLSYANVPEGSWTFGSIGYVATGVAGEFASTNPSDALFDLVYSLRAGYRTQGKFVMNRRTQAALRKFKTTTGDYIWEPPSAANGHPTLMGFPVIEAEDMPDISIGSFSVAFGDFERGYLVVDRIGIRILRDPYSNKPYVLFYTTKRVGGGVQDLAAIKLLKFDVS